MIKLTDIDGKAFYLAPAAIAQITPASIACRRHGVLAIVETFAGRQWGVHEEVSQIVASMNPASNLPKEDPCS